MGNIVSRILLISIMVCLCQTSRAETFQIKLMKYRLWEYNSNFAIEQKLNRKIQLFFEAKTDSFIDNEYGILNSYKHMAQAVYMSEEEYKALFFKKFLEYYRTTDLQNELNFILQQYEKELCFQRHKALKQNVHSKSIKIRELPTIRISSNSPIDRTNNELTDELIGIISDRIPMILSFILGILGIFSCPKTKVLGIIVFVLSLLYFTYKGYVYDSEMKKQLLQKSEEYIRENRIEIKKQLDDETERFYKSMGL